MKRLDEVFSLSDSLLLGYCQRISDFFQIWFGRDNFSIAKLFGIISIIFYCLQLIFAFLEGVNPAFIFFSSVSVVLIPLMSKQFKKIRETCHNNPKYENLAKLSFFETRFKATFLLLFTTLFLPVAISTHFIEKKDLILQLLFLDISVFFFTFFLYFLSCTPKPTQTSKVKKLIERIKRLRKSVTPLPSMN